MEHITLEEYKQLQQKGNSKYKAKKTSIDGGEIRGFCIQPTFILAPNLKYKADFIVFNNDGTTEIIDVKGMKTKEYIVKKKVFEDKFNLKIKEV